MGSAARTLGRRAVITIAVGLGFGIVLGLIYGKLRLGLFVGVTFALAFTISMSGLGPTSRDQ